jgi:carbonic anhydrase/acetyltransferase-like protein (isoleucine patch superfamily)
LLIRAPGNHAEARRQFCTLAVSPTISDVRQGAGSILRVSGKSRHMIYELDGQRPELPESGGYWIAPGATVIGKVRLKTDSSIWFGAVLRGDNEWIELGERSQIQDNATLHTDPGFPITIGTDCVIGHNVILHGCTVGPNSLIGMGAILLNGACIGANCLVGAGALITEGKTFPERSLIVGAPARAVRTLDDAALQKIAEAADNYVRRFKRYANGLKPIG